MQQRRRTSAGSLAAFFTDLGPLADKVTLVTLSEFGRRVAENANTGLDHGYGNVMFLAGAGVKGGAYYGTLARASATPSTPTCWSPPTTAACCRRSWSAASAPAPRPCSPGSSAGRSE